MCGEELAEGYEGIAPRPSAECPTSELIPDTSEPTLILFASVRNIN